MKNYSRITEITKKNVTTKIPYITDTNIFTQLNQTSGTLGYCDCEGHLNLSCHSY
jgi:hypothetical protein